ncbi:hypothetical protein BDM02DRAFT_3112644 [Thelephora ganbajun]|uniref:Uncharacterized protein n=1 Tax=Thelephora ganbajun TaxID=370292 RepID=A0ACB6ZKB9_THEGA|nr:hypothetical protein BDM02DRAFT_3112644 [Thelephora ganbajun]
MLKLSPHLDLVTLCKRKASNKLSGGPTCTQSSVVKRPMFHGQQPTTEGQKTFVASRWDKAPKYVQGETTRDATRSLCIQRLTKGKAANIITHIKHGADEYTTKAMRKEELRLKELRRQAREVVVVGLLAAH